jgi:hypothetical protein
MARITVLEPVAEPRPVPHPLAERPDTLAGKRIAFLNNSKPNVPILFEAIERRLQERFGLAGTAYRVKVSAPIPTDPLVLEELARDYDACITAVAD